MIGSIFTFVSNVVAIVKRRQELNNSPDVVKGKERQAEEREAEKEVQAVAEKDIKEIRNRLR